MDISIGLGLLAFSAPITAAIVKLLPSRNDGKYVTVREYDSSKKEITERLKRIEQKIDNWS